MGGVGFRETNSDYRWDVLRLEYWMFVLRCVFEGSFSECLFFTTNNTCLLCVAWNSLEKKNNSKCDVLNLENKTSDYTWEVLKLIRLFFCSSAPGSLKMHAFSLHFYNLGSGVEIYILISIRFRGLGGEVVTGSPGIIENANVFFAFS